VGEIEAIGAVTLTPVYQTRDIWRDDVIHVEGIHREAFDEVERLFRALKAGHRATNIALQGRPGIGKSHFLGRLRRIILTQDDVFILLKIAHAEKFWESASVCIRDSLFQQGPSGSTQLASLLAALAAKADVPDDVSSRLVSGTFLPKDLETYVNSVARKLGHPPKRRAILDALITLSLVNHEDLLTHDVGYTFASGGEIAADESQRFGLSAVTGDACAFVHGVDRLIGLADRRALVAIDQLDGLVAAINNAEAYEARRPLELVANGLMDLAEDLQFSLVVVAALPVTWARITHEAVPSAADRYPRDLQLRTLPSPEVARNLVAAYLQKDYARVLFRAPYPTWPFKPSAFVQAETLSPRELLKLVDRHLLSCRSRGQVVELDAFDLASGTIEGTRVDPQPAEPAPSDLADLDQRFKSYAGAADLSMLHKDDDPALPDLLQSALLCWIEENGDGGRFSLDPPPGRDPSLHARLRQVLNADLEDEMHWCFRAVQHGNAKAALTRLRGALASAGKGPRRKLYIIRNAAWSAGARTQTVAAELLSGGGEVVALDEKDLRTLHSLARLRREEPPALAAWLALRKPASNTSLLRRVQPIHPERGALAPAPIETTPPPATGGEPSPRAPGVPLDAPEGAITIGHVAGHGSPVHIRLDTLRRHVAIFAGSGSGKTVFIRRIIEECALSGVSAIVLDPNNDLARLGLAWPESPSGWRDGDDVKAREYFAETETLVWTPRLSSGRPLAFSPLSDLNAVMNDADEFELGLDNAVASLIGRSGLPNGQKRDFGKAVMKEALRAFFTNGTGGLDEFLVFLEDLPDRASSLDGASALARRMAQSLRAAKINDPLFGGSGAAVDPGMLLTPSSGKRARISVISLVGLPNDEQRQGFVAQLQMSLFAWVKKNPANDRPLGGLLVMDEAQIFAASTGASLCLSSTLALASQARKYGLGLIFATQAPKGLHNRIPGNATTQVFGFLNVPVQIAAAKEMASAKGGDVGGIAQLIRGQFFVASEGIAFQKLETPMCLSYHPSGPLTQEEIVRLARGDG